jgi:hypothetical protein
LTTDPDRSTVVVPVYALTNLVAAAIKYGVGDEVAAAIAHLRVIARAQGVEIKPSP